MPSPPTHAVNSLARAASTISIALILASCAFAQQVTPELSFAKDVRPFLRQHCFDCHGPDEQSGEVALHTFADKKAILGERSQWENVLKMLKFGAMPPDDQARPDKESQKKVVRWLEATLFAVDCSQPTDPGRVTIRRLNRNEYNNTIHDLLGVSIRPADDFPADDVGEGFDNIGDVLSLPPLLLEKYLDAAEAVAAETILVRTPEDAHTARRTGRRLKGKNTSIRGDIHSMSSTATVTGDFYLERDGTYLFNVSATGNLAGDELPKLQIKLDGKEIGVIEVQTEYDEFRKYSLEQTTTKGKHQLSATFINDFYNPKSRDPKQRDRNAYVQALGYTGPMDTLESEQPASYQRLVTTRPSKDVSLEQASRQVLTPFLKRCFRRPVHYNEVTPFVRLVSLADKQGESYERGLQVAVSAALVSPHFLFRLELDSDPENAKRTRSLSDYELATRLSYFLWSSMPDDELFRLADQNKLRDDRTLEQQVKRMLKDEKAEAFVENFAGQWLNLRNLADVDPDPKQFKFDDRLRADMITETYRLFSTIMQEDRSILDFLDADFTFVNERLARHYGIPDVKGSKFQRVSLAGSPRLGVLTHGSVLTLTSNPARTSPVKRGKWVLDNLLGTPPPDPPADVPTLEETATSSPSASFREQLELHRRNPTCASCHKEMDAIGFGLENFDPVGRFRERDGKHLVDATGTLPGGESFEGATQLISVLKKRSDDFTRCLTEKMLTYALGRGLKFQDKCEVDRITKSLKQNEHLFSVLVWEVVRSDLFRLRRGEGEKQ